ncbi:hypothetical protein HDV05_002815 [Chytridiales sp. JEL 0842]|nr:hypothetical protein HDV05_002815 [Chytridiales sp. JEL 0842]
MSPATVNLVGRDAPLKVDESAFSGTRAAPSHVILIALGVLTVLLVTFLYWGYTRQRRLLRQQEIEAPLQTPTTKVSRPPVSKVPIKKISQQDGGPTPVKSVYIPSWKRVSANNPPKSPTRSGGISPTHPNVQLKRTSSWGAPTIKTGATSPKRMSVNSQPEQGGGALTVNTGVGIMGSGSSLAAPSPVSPPPFMGMFGVGMMKSVSNTSIQLGLAPSSKPFVRSQSDVAQRASVTAADMPSMGVRVLVRSGSLSGNGISVNMKKGEVGEDEGARE